MQIEALAIPDVKLIHPKRFSDPRGFFSETYHQHDFHQAGIFTTFPQDCYSLSIPKGTVRGLHFQLPPYEQAKLVGITRGAIFDVALDIRRDSPTFGQHVSAILSAKEWNQLYIPAGFAHGFCTLEENTEITYKMSNIYAPEYERGILWNDPALGIRWPLDSAPSAQSPRDQDFPRLADANELL